MSLPDQPSLAMDDFRRLGDFIHAELGIKMPDAKRGMVESRLRKRLSILNMPSYGQYCEYLFSSRGLKDELPMFINQITTNKTDFFRESKQFVFLTKTALPELLSSVPAGGRKRLYIWSSACSRGHEPYTLAMVLAEYAQKLEDKAMDFSILGTDISTDVLQVAKKAVYSHEEIEPVPMALRKKYLLRSKDRRKNTVRISPELRNKVRLLRLNLMNKHYTRIDFSEQVTGNGYVEFDFAERNPEDIGFAFSDDDSSDCGLTAALGINTFFEGVDAMSMEVNDELADTTFIAAAKIDSETGEVSAGDNSNALYMADVQYTDVTLKLWTYERGEDAVSSTTTATLDDYYNTIISSLGIESQSIKNSKSFSDTMVNSITEQRDSVSAVSLDEEMIKLMKYQHAFSAASKLLTVSDEMLDTLISTR